MNSEDIYAKRAEALAQAEERVRAERLAYKARAVAALKLEHFADVTAAQTHTHPAHERCDIPPPALICSARLP